MCPFLQWDVDSLEVEILCFLQILDISPFSDKQLAKIFLPFYGISPEFSDCFIIMQKLFSLMQSHLFILSLWYWACWVILRKLFPISISFSIFLTTSWSCFKVSDLILRSLVHFELILVQGERQGSSFSLLHVNIQISQQICWTGCLFSIVCFGILCWRSVGCRCVRLWLGLLF
jgi:hypothetical protein